MFYSSPLECASLKKGRINFFSLLTVRSQVISSCVKSATLTQYLFFSISCMLNKGSKSGSANQWHACRSGHTREYFPHGAALIEVVNQNTANSSPILLYLIIP